MQLTLLMGQWATGVIQVTILGPFLNGFFPQFEGVWGMTVFSLLEVLHPHYNPYFDIIVVKFHQGNVTMFQEGSN